MKYEEFNSDDAKVMLSRKVENEHLGVMGASVIEIWRMSDGCIVEHSFSNGGGSLEVKS